MYIEEKMTSKEQSKKIKTLIKRRQFQEAKEIGEKFIDNAPIQSQMVTIAIREGDKEETKESIKNIIKTKIYWDKITGEVVDEINNNNNGLTEYEKTIMMLAICQKNN